MKLNPDLSDVIEAINECKCQHSAFWWVSVIAIGILLNRSLLQMANREKSQGISRHHAREA